MIYVAIVIYNKKCSESISMSSVEKWMSKEEFKMIVFDNSTKDYGNKEYCQKKSYKYITYYQNKGLSFAYNRIVENIGKEKANYILILDDDTELNEEFVKEIKECKEADIYLPIVRSNKDDYFFSPSIKVNRVRTVPIFSIEEIKNKRITAINSGMLVKTNVYENILYDEDLFLDYVDHDFMDKVNEKEYKIKILSATIFQDISRQNISNTNGVKNRFQIYGKDYKIYCFKRKKYFFYFLSFFKTTISFCIKTRDISYLYIYLSCIIKKI